MRLCKPLEIVPITLSTLFAIAFDIESSMLPILATIVFDNESISLFLSVSFMVIDMLMLVLSFIAGVIFNWLHRHKLGTHMKFIKSIVDLFLHV